MYCAYKSRRDVLALGILLACCRCAFALDPSLDISQYAHTAWKVRDGFTKGSIWSIAQTPDGYLWLGTDFGLLRFDGVRAVEWKPPAGESLPSGRVRALLAARDGTLWIGTDSGLASYRDGKLTQYPDYGHSALILLEDRDQVLWVSSGYTDRQRSALCAFQTGQFQCYGQDGSLGNGITGMYEDRAGHLWGSSTGGLWHWKPGPPKYYPIPAVQGAIYDLAEGNDNSILVAAEEGVLRLANGKAERYPLPETAGHFHPHHVLRDRDGEFWIGSASKGLLHLHGGMVDLYGQSDGLSGDFVSGLCEDREGNVWVTTTDGLDRFRGLAVPTISVRQGLSNSAVQSVLAARDGGLWFGTLDGIDRWRDGQVTVFRKRKTQSGNGRRVREIIDPGLPDDRIESFFEDQNERLWVSTAAGIGQMNNGRFIPVTGIPRKYANCMTEDRDANVWISQTQALFRWREGGQVERIPWESIGPGRIATVLVSDNMRGGLWLGFWDGGVAYLKEGRVKESYSPADGLAPGLVSQIQLDRDGTLWAATRGGLSRIKDGRVATLSSKNGLPCDGVHWMMEDDTDSVWLYMPCGLARIAKSEFHAWAADPKRRLEPTVFASSEGVRVSATGTGGNPPVAKTADGRIWFVPFDGVSIIDPRHLPVNKLPPPVHIEQITADRKTYWQNLSGDASSSRPKMPPLVRDLEIDYTALSMVVPEKNRFRVKLEGWDSDWKDAGNERRAFYSNLPPRNYRFRVAACNNSGLWNEAGDTLEFSIAPAYYQTLWFRLACVAAFLALLWTLYQYRLHQVAQEFNRSLEARVAERTRIARELHDTLLQSFHGLLLRFQSASNLLPERPTEAKQRLDSAIDQAAQAITEGRDAVQGLRASTVETNDLALALSTLGRELAAHETNRNSAVLRVDVEGTPRNLHPILRDEVYRIAGEALRNASRHAQARKIEVEIRYDERELRLRVRDDGKGIDSKILSGDGRDGHFGLRGMRERAKLVGGQLEVWSDAGEGTEVELSIPASIAYAKAPPRA